MTDNERNRHVTVIEDRAERELATVERVTGHDLHSPHAICTESGDAILDDVYRYIGRFVSYPNEHTHIAHTLWIAHAHLMDVWDSTPRIAFLSPEPGSGKSRALEVTSPLVPRAVVAVNTTPAYLFRKVADEAGRPTILYDEIDTVFGPKAKDNEEIRGLLNAGHRKGAVAGRCVIRGNQVFTEEISAYSAVALAGLGGLPDTILSRAVVIRMRRRAQSEHVEPYRPRLNESEGQRIGERLGAWSACIEHRIRLPDPEEFPAGVEDRDADVWEALLAVADAAGGDWPRRVREAAVALVAESKQTIPSLGVRLLADMRRVFDGYDVLSTETILRALNGMEEAPWGDLRGKPLDSRGLSRLLGQYEIKPTTVRIGNSTPKGYRRTDMHDAWSRYLSVSPESATNATRATSEAGCVDSVADVADVADLQSMDRGEMESFDL